MAVSKPFADILAARREAFNSIVQTARAGASNFDTDAFSNFLETEVDAIVQAVCEVDPARAARAAEDVFEMAVNLVAQRRAGPGARDTLINQLWRDVAPHMPKLIADDAIESLGALTNSAVYVSAQRGLRVQDWVKSLSELVMEIDATERLRHLITIVTWRSGGAHIRSAALEAVSALPPHVAFAAMGLPENTRMDKTLAALHADIWWTPDSPKKSMGHAVGGFTGLGGPFSAPPELRAIDDGFLVSSANQYFHLSVDAFGAVIQSALAEDWSETDIAATQSPGKKLDVSDLSLGMPKQGLEICLNRETVAIFSPHSHFIRVLPRARTA